MPENRYHLRIRPKRGLFDIDLKELWNYRDMIVLFVRRDFVSVYKQTILGPLWFIIQPVISTVMFTVVFGNIAKLPTAGLPAPLFYMSGLVGWGYFANCLQKTSDTFISNASIFGKVYFPRLAVPISITISNLIQFGIQLCVLIVFMAIYSAKGISYDIGFSLILIPMLLLLLAGLGLGFGIIISSMTTKYRDLRQLVSFGITLWMYVTPVIFPLESVSGKYKIFFLINPLTGVVESFRTVLLGTGNLNFTHLGYSFVCMTVVLTCGILLFNRIERNFMDFV